MEIREMNIEELEARKAQIAIDIESENADINALSAEIDAIEARKNELKELAEKRAKIVAAVASGEIGTVSETINIITEDNNMSVIEERANKFAENNKLTIETRQLLSTGTLKPAGVKETIGELPEVMSSIVDDVHSFDATGMGSWTYSYRATDSAAAAVTEGSAVAGTAGTFTNTGAINPSVWGILDEVSNQVKKMTPLNYMQSVQHNAYLALRRTAKAKIVAAILASSLTDSKTYSLDQHFVRNLVLGFNADESVAGDAKLYLCKQDLATLGQVRGTNEKKAVFEITFTDQNNGIIKDGGMAVKFSLCSDLYNSNGNKMIYGQMQAVDMPLWGNYEIATDEGGDYFKRNMIGIRGIQTAGADVTRLHAVQVIN